MEREHARPVDIGRILDEGRWTGYQKFLVFLTALTIIFDGADNQLLGISLPAIMREWSLERGAFAPILALGLIGMMIGGAAAGIVGDRLGRKVALIASVAVFSLTTLAVAFANGPGALGVLRFISGLGLGGALPNAAALASEFVPQRQRPFAVTLTIVCVPLGGTLAGSFAIQALPALGWRTLFIIGGTLPAVLTLLLLRLLPESPRFLARHPRRWAELAAVLRRMERPAGASDSFVDMSEKSTQESSVRMLLSREFRGDTVALWCAFFSCLLAVYLGFNWVPSMLTGAGLSPAAGSAGIAAFNLGGVAGAVGGALLFPRLGSKPTMLTMAAGAVAGAVIMQSMTIAAGSAAAPIVVMLGITGGLINAVQTTMYALAAQVYPTIVRATGVGSAIAIGRSGAILSTYAGAWALEAGGSPLFFTLVAGAMTASLISLASVRRHIKPAAKPANRSSVVDDRP